MGDENEPKRPESEDDKENVPLLLKDSPPCKEKFPPIVPLPENSPNPSAPPKLIDPKLADEPPLLPNNVLPRLNVVPPDSAGASPPELLIVEFEKEREEFVVEDSKNVEEE